MSEKKNIPFGLKNIENIQFATIDESYTEGCDINLNVEIPIKASDEDHRIAVFLKVQFKCEDKPFIILEVQFDFEIAEEAFKELLISKKKKTSLVIPVGLTRHLATIAVGTARGILFEKLKKTKFKEFILPTLDLTKILEEDTVLERD